MRIPKSNKRLGLDIVSIVLKYTLVLFVLFFNVVSSTFSQGRTITITTQDGRKETGELLSVRDSVVSILINLVPNDMEIAKHPELVKIVLVGDIDEILMHKYTVTGMKEGALIGGFLGVFTGLISEVNTRSFDGYDGNSIPSPGYIKSTTIGGVGGALCGMVIGWGVATILSKGEEILHPSKTGSIISIRKYARFENSEPHYVRDIINTLLNEAE